MRWFWIALLSLSLSDLALLAQKVKVLDRANLGSMTEDITFVMNGPYAGHIVLLDGYEVLGVAAEGRGESAVKKLFDLRNLPLGLAPRGLAYIETEKLFVVNDSTQPSKLFFVDHQGHYQGSRNIQYLGGYLPGHVEGIGYIPASSARWPDHIAMATIDDVNLGGTRVEIINRQGQVVHEYLPPPDVGFIAAIAYWSPDRLLVVDYWSEAFWSIDLLTGEWTWSGEASTEIAEGLVQMRSGRFAAGGAGGWVFFGDENLNYLPGEDRQYQRNLGIDYPAGLAWNTDTQHLMVSNQLVNPNGRSFLSIPVSLDTTTLLGTILGPPALRVSRAVYMADEHMYALTRYENLPAQPDPAILLLNESGVIVNQINLAAYKPALGNPYAITYVPALEKFLVQFGTYPTRLYFVSKTGAVDTASYLDLAGAGLTGTGWISAVAYFNPDHPTGGQLFVAGRVGTLRLAVITDLAANPLGQFDYTEELGLFGIQDAEVLGSGPDGITFAVLDNWNGEIVVFRLK